MHGWASQILNIVYDIVCPLMYVVRAYIDMPHFFRAEVILRHPISETIKCSRQSVMITEAAFSLSPSLPREQTSAYAWTWTFGAYVACSFIMQERPLKVIIITPFPPGNSVTKRETATINSFNMFSLALDLISGCLTEISGSALH